jgi:hypothetical protein
LHFATRPISFWTAPIFDAYELRDEANELEAQAIQDVEDAINCADEKDAEIARARLTEISGALQSIPSSRYPGASNATRPLAQSKQR